MIIPIFQGEIAHPSIRGRVTALQQFMLGIGSFVAGWLSYGTYSINNTGAFRSESHLWASSVYTPFSAANETPLATTVPLGIQIFPAIILASLILMFPESPRWLMDHGHKEEGLKTLARLHAHGDVDDPLVKAEFAQIEEAIAFDHEHEAKSYAELFRTRFVQHAHQVFRHWELVTWSLTRSAHLQFFVPAPPNCMLRPSCLSDDGRLCKPLFTTTAV